ncbi:MAG: c-type cytochrome [Candidatus Nitrohelix vancouverensis]|uniref:C-type cytochrome n=1 Tax=Candidatus Nitrohelix vancouverensis TaxID=2705534 RepID=A0A7T0C595_9BACT|nr:MAG: c-type cytochrome [Candidatus Nitrohelix vancouverensis]
MQKAGLIVVVSLAIAGGVWVLFGVLGFADAARLGGVALTLVGMTYALLLAIPSGELKEKTFFQNIKFKIPGILVIGAIIWVVAGKAGFPIWWQIEFVAFAGVGLVYFIILDSKAMKEEQRHMDWIVRLLGTYAIASGIFITITAQLPQFDPAVEIAKLEKPPIKLSGLAGPEVIAAGRAVFQENKCFNCHKVFWEGNSDRGPNLGTKQIGLYSEEYIKEQVVNPRVLQSPGFEDPKSVKAMPTYYGEDLSEDEMHALVSYMKTLRDPEHAPVEGKLGEQWTWFDDPKIIEEGKKIFNGEGEGVAEGLNCAVCHGKDGIPMMTGALDFRDDSQPDTDKMPDQLKGVPLRDWPDSLWYKRVTRGVDGTPMAAWGSVFPHLILWKTEAYARTFHSPLESRTEKRPIPPVPTKEDIERWKTEGLFMDPLL